MTATLLEGRTSAAVVRDSLKDRVRQLVQGGSRAPALHIVLVGGDASGRMYAEGLQSAGERIGVVVNMELHPESLTEPELVEIIAAGNTDPAVDAIVVTMPLPEHLSPECVSSALDRVKDVDGATFANAGRLYLGREAHVPPTALAIMGLLQESGREIRGAHAVVVGRSPVVGRPAAMLLLREHATVTICHTRTADLAGETKRADILVAAAGSPGCIDGSMIKPGAVVIDAGINPVEGGIVGDVNFQEALEVAGAVTPVPGGVGPLTTVLLLQAVVENAERRKPMVETSASLKYNDGC